MHGTCYREAWFPEDSSSPLCRNVQPPGPPPVRTAGSRRSRIPAIPGPSPPSGSPPPPADKTPECASCRVGRPHRGRPARRRTQLRSRRGERQDREVHERISRPKIRRPQSQITGMLLESNSYNSLILC
jgi:hypothetical protein